MPKVKSSIVRLIQEYALELGFERVGIIPAETPRRIAAFDAWLEAGRHGEMAYMARHRDLRADPIGLHEGTRSIVVVAMSYNPREDDGAEGGVARYARGRDYHRLLRKRLKRLGGFIDDELGTGSCLPRAFVDSAPVLERDLAERAGLGWVGKSANVIAQGLGSYMFLGEVFVGHALPTLTHDAPDRCGRCTACIDLCPTKAIVAPFEVDARRCISYLTIELRGPIPRPLRPLIGGHLFGCDICQIVCPWNRKASPLKEAAFRPRPEVLGLTAADVLTLDQSAFDSRFAGSPLRRTGREGLARNAAVVLGNSGDPRAVSHLASVLRADPSPLVRGHAAWALGHLGIPKAQTLLEISRISESDPAVHAEIDAALGG